MKATEKIHHGKNVKRFREMLGLKQEWLAFELGDDWSQKKVSQLENKEEIDDTTLEEIAKLLKVPAEAIKNFSEEAAIYNIQNNYDNAQVTSSPVNATYCTFNPLDKWLEAMEENKKLYERLLQTEREKVELMERLMNGKK
ncbi:helix-turn-helix domain-containing protein [Chitinophagaceae bacterium MMS25-I14]